MHLFSRLSPLVLAACVLLSGCTAILTPINAPNGTPTTGATVSGVELLGVISVPFNMPVFETPVGGLSGVAYDSGQDTYYFVSDDRAANGPARIYQATIDLESGVLESSDLQWTGLIALTDESGMPFGRGTIDPEGLVYTDEYFYVASEGNGTFQPPLAPAIIQFTSGGEFVASLPLPAWYIPSADGSRGARNNRALESLTRTPDGRYLISGIENALAQDGPIASLDSGSPARILLFDLTTNSVAAEYVYLVNAIPAAPFSPTGEASNGLADLLAIGDFSVEQGVALLALERSYVDGVGNTIRLYRVSTVGARDVSTLDTLVGNALVTPVTKELLLDFDELGSQYGITPDNLEGLALGPLLPDGRQTIVVISDNNFNPLQTTQLWVLALARQP